MWRTSAKRERKTWQQGKQTKKAEGEEKRSSEKIVSLRNRVKGLFFVTNKARRSAEFHKCFSERLFQYSWFITWCRNPHDE
jgi:hypothetical protein